MIEKKDARVCPKCGAWRECLTCQFVGEGPYNILCYRDHFGVSVALGCGDWSCKKCAQDFEKELSAKLRAMTPTERRAFMRGPCGHKEKVK